MSLAVPYLLDAAVELAPHATLRLAGHELTLTQLGHGSAKVADSFLAHGWAPGDRVTLPDLTSAHGLVVALGACRIGVRLADADDGPTAHEQVVDRDVAESNVWSETVLAELGSRVVTHGDVVNAVPVPLALTPLVEVVAATFEIAVGGAA